MDLTNFWFSSGAAGGGGGDPGDPIGESLRFGVGKQFYRNSQANPTQWSINYWYKIGFANFNGGGGYHFSWHYGSTTYNIASFGVTSGTTGASPTGVQPLWCAGLNAWRNINTALQFRDPSAWYNFHWTNDNGTVTLFINGALIGTATGVSNSAGNFTIGGQNRGSSNKGYFSNFYFIDGQDLQPTDFGRFNNDGVWVPVAYDGDADDYGAGGFHLTFADPDNLGEDTAPTGGTGHTAANDFTESGFDTDPVGIFSNELVSSTGSFGTNAGPERAFDGSTTTFAQTSATGGTMTFTPITPINYQSLHYFNFGATWNLNNGTTGGTTGASGWQQIDGSSGTLTTLQFLNDAGGAAAVGAIAINGTAAANILVDNTGTDYDLMQDSPTQNWATLNPVLEPTNQTLSDANLRGGTSSTATSLTTQLPDYQYYWEGLGSNYYYGISEIDAVRDSYLGSKANQVGWFNDGSFWVGTSNVGTFGPSFATTDVAMQAYDPATGNYWVGINGTWHGGGDPENGTNPAFTVSADFRERMLPASNVSSGTNSYNFGQQPFLFPVPDGFSALQTQNMPAATIANGRDHFVVHLDPGAAILPAAQGLFPNGLWWIKDMVNSNQHQLVDSINGNSCVRLPGPTSPANYTAPAGDSVAWCWSTTEDWTGNGVTTNRRDPVAGFSHFNYTGNGADTRDLDHGLGTPPEFVFIFDPNANDVKCYVNGLTGTGSSTQNLILSTSEAASNVFSAGIIYRPEDNDTFTVGLSQSPTNVNSVNQNGVTYRAYCWAPVPGYSAFGSYTGNSSTDGPFIYTGFRPAWVMWKRTNSGAGNPDWYIIDSTRSPFNLASEKLAANTTDSEQNPTGENVLDFLSNGFKIRAGNQSQNATGGDFIYCAFASNPFGGSNVSPANAR